MTLEERYVSKFADDGIGRRYELAGDYYLLARDIRRTEAMKREDNVIVAHLGEIYSKAVFVLWPPSRFGRIERPKYNISDVPIPKIILDRALEIFVNS